MDARGGRVGAHRAGSRWPGMVAATALLLALLPGSAAGRGDPGLAVTVPETAEMGTTIRIAVDADLGTDHAYEDISIDIALADGMRPVGEGGCAFRATAWSYHCEPGAMSPWYVEPPAETPYLARSVVEVLVVAQGRQAVTARLRVGGELVDRETVAVDVTYPAVVIESAPLFRFSAGEVHWPGDATDFIEASTLRFARVRCPDAEVVPEGDVRAAGLGLVGGKEDESEPRRGVCGDPHDPPWVASEGTRPVGSDGFYQPAKDQGSVEGFFLDLDDALLGGMRPSSASGTYDGGAPLYIQYRRGTPERGPGYVRYWVFSPCSEAASIAPDKIGLVDRACWHEGDWEGVAIALDADTNRPTRIAYFAHVGAPDIRAFAQGSIELVDGTHPVVWVGEGSHASYAEGVRHDACLWDFACGEDVTGDAWEWRSWEADIVSVEGEPWFGYGGAWGAALPAAKLFSTAGPAGPGYVDPLGGAWAEGRDDGIDRCDPGEVHPETPTKPRTSCTLTAAEREGMDRVGGGVACRPVRDGRPADAVVTVRCSSTSRVIESITASLMSQDAAHAFVRETAEQAGLRPGTSCFDEDGYETGRQVFFMGESPAGRDRPTRGDAMGLGQDRDYGSTGASENWIEYACFHRPDGRVAIVGQGPLCTRRSIRVAGRDVDRPSVQFTIDAATDDLRAMLRPEWMDSWGLPGDIANAWHGCYWLLDENGEETDGSFWLP